jgi:hypothetical protein
MDLLQRILKEGISYEAFLRSIEEKVAEGKCQGREECLPLNLQRMRRIGRTFRIPEEFCQWVSRLHRPQVWMVLTEDWCGDSAQTLPYIAKIAACSSQIQLKILARDEHPDVMNLFLTDGKRSIPVLAAFDGSGNLLFRWGPRPREAAEIFARAIARGASKDQALLELHTWYSKNRGRAVLAELAEKLMPWLPAREVPSMV